MDEFADKSSIPSRIGGLETLGRYELICVMSRAEYGSTWACIATSPPQSGRVFSLRRIVIHPGEEDVVSEPLVRVANDWEGVTRPGMLPILDSVVSVSRLGIVSQYAEGEPLRSVLNLARLRNMPIPQNVALRIVADLLAALVNLAGAGLKKPELRKSLYGGVLPDVVLVSVRGETLLTEPGVTAAATLIPSLMQHEKLLAYQAPEQLSGSPADARTDVFAIGVLFWEMLAGRSLFLEDVDKSEKDVLTLIRKRVSEANVPRLDDPSLNLKQQVGKQLADIVARAVQKNPSARFSSAQELSASLRKAVGTTAAQPRDVSAYLAEVIGSILEMRRTAIERVSFVSPPEPVPEPVRGEAALDTDEVAVYLEFGDGDELEELLPEPPTGAYPCRPAPPRIRIKPAPAPNRNDDGTSEKQTSGSVTRVPVFTDAVASMSKLPGATLLKFRGDHARGSGPGAESDDKRPAPVQVPDFGGKFEAPWVEDEAKKSTEPAESKNEPLDAPTQGPDNDKPTNALPAEAPRVPHLFRQPFTPLWMQETPAILGSSAVPMPDPRLQPEPPEPGAQDAPAQPVLAANDHFDPENGVKERKRRRMFIVGGIVGAAVFLMLIAGIAFVTGDSDTPGALTASAPPAAVSVLPARSQDASSAKAADASPATAVEADAAKDAQVVAEDAQGATPTPPQAPRRRKPTPYMPSGI